MKRKPSPHGLTLEEEVRAWACLFETGRDYFANLDVLGLDYRFGVPDPVPIDVRDAWDRVGPTFLAERAYHPHPRVPWALETFGPPR